MNESKERLECIESEISNLKNRLEKLETKPGTALSGKKLIEIEIEWPESIDTGGLSFNAQKTKGVFELKEDGNYYSRDILFNSARDTDNGTGNDLLSDYLDCDAVQEAFQEAFQREVCDDDLVVTRIFLPEKNQGVKKYNGVTWWYWLKEKIAASSACFASVSNGGGTYGGNDGGTYGGNASSVGGCAPAFCVAKRHG